MSEQCELCGDQDSLVLQSRCHFTAPLQAEKVDGWLILRCYLPECRKEVARYPITPDSYQQGRVAGIKAVRRKITDLIDRGFTDYEEDMDDLIEWTDFQLAQQAQEGGVGDGNSTKV